MVEVCKAKVNIKIEHLTVATSIHPYNCCGPFSYLRREGKKDSIASERSILLHEIPHPSASSLRREPETRLSLTCNRASTERELGDYVSEDDKKVSLVYIVSIDDDLDQVCSLKTVVEIFVTHNRFPLPPSSRRNENPSA